MGKQGEVLEHHTHTSLLHGYLFGRTADPAAVDSDFAMAGLFKSCNRAQQRGLAAAAWAEQATDAALPETQGDVRDDGLAIVADRQVVDFKHRLNGIAISRD